MNDYYVALVGWLTINFVMFFIITFSDSMFFTWIMVAINFTWNLGTIPPLMYLRKIMITAFEVEERNRGEKAAN